MIFFFTTLKNNNSNSLYLIKIKKIVQDKYFNILSSKNVNFSNLL